MSRPSSNTSRVASGATERLLQSIAKVTEHRDCRHFRSSLATTIGEILPVQEVVFARPVRGESGTSYQILHAEAPRALPDSTSNGMVAAIDKILSPQNVAAMLSQGQQLTVTARSAVVLLPVIFRDSLMEIVVLRAKAIPTAALDVMKAFIRLYRNFLALIHESETDPLTGLYNRKTLEVGLRQVINEANELSRSHLRPDGADQRRGGPRQHGYLAVIDIDRFKRINDTLGHVFGDEVIILVARLMREMFRDEDALFRYGGEEFVVVLLAEDAAGARAAMERLRTRVAAHRFPQLDQVTVSIGFAKIHDDDVVSGVVGRADKALYHSKTSGRDRTTDYAELLASGEVTEAKVYGAVDLF